MGFRGKKPRTFTVLRRGAPATGALIVARLRQRLDWRAAQATSPDVA